MALWMMWLAGVATCAGRMAMLADLWPAGRAESLGRDVGPRSAARWADLNSA